MTRSMRSSLVAALSFATMLVCFQNCSNANFSLQAGGATTAASSGTPDSTGVTTPPESQTVETAVMIECELSSPNEKIILNAAGNFDVGSNNSGTRVCMSQNACLSLLNVYSVQRQCGLALGAAESSSAANTQCTEVFPGSDGTCNNAKMLTDPEVASILSKMAQAQ